MDGVRQEFILSSGDLNYVVFFLPVGIFDIWAEVHESGGTFAEAQISSQFNSYVPTEEEFVDADLDAQLDYYSSVGDTAAVAQLLAAAVSS